MKVPEENGMKNPFKKTKKTRLTIAWDRYTRNNAVALSIKEIWDKRYYLNWKDPSLVSRLTCDDVLYNQGTLGSLEYFIQWHLWTRYGNNRDMDNDFFVKHKDYLDIVWMIKNFRLFPNITDDAWSKATAAYLKQKETNSRFISRTMDSSEGFIIGIPHDQEHRRAEFADEQMTIINNRPAKASIMKTKKS